MAAPYVPFTAATNRGRSRQIWGSFPTGIITGETPQSGYFAHEDFTAIAATALASNLQYIHADKGGWQAWIATSGSIANTTTDNPNGPTSSQANAIGVAQMAASTTTHNSVILQQGKVSESFGVSSTAGSLPKLYFEIRCRFNVAGASNTIDYDIGFKTGGLATANNTTISTADALVTTSIYGIGFRSLNEAAIKAYYMAAATPTLPTVATAGAIPTTLTNFTKLGFVYDPTAAQQLQYFQDGVLMAYSNSTPASNWPSNKPMTPTVTYQLGGTGTTDSKFDIDWIDWGIVTDGF